ncbi:hypothetical protein [Pedobacter kyonggii]|uniref:Uncharacterized protein n=1 Tax=Pedobacter kyonggii TaxID=1926871 RepID=A0A4Q9HGN7_9SPHI|nr:hypothetical protein [Pedobacter kyonggii]TBO44398.1 hypothetical protein EYS08_03555 [Pedobacter kyonggii]
MQGINKGRHEQLKNALAQLMNLLDKDMESEQCIQLAGDYRKELEHMYSDYINALAGLEQLVTEYEILYSQVKTQFLAKKLKELKREIRTKHPIYALLAENIQLTYGT